MNDSWAPFLGVEDAGDVTVQIQTTVLSHYSL